MEFKLPKKVLIIAEAASQHSGSIAAAKQLALAAKEAGADIVKFQLHVPGEEIVPGTVKFWAGSMDEILEKVRFQTFEEHKELKDYCDQIGIQYLCTPFCIEASNILERVGVDAYKIGSGELTNLPMIRHVAKKGKFVILSTGMSVWEEIDDAVEVLREESANFAITHCASEYPAQYENLNLGMIKLLRDKFKVPVGFSDHTVDIYSSIAAVALGAKIIEKHFTMKELHGPDDFVSLDPVQFRQMVDAIRKVEKALGSVRAVLGGEKETRAWAHHSVVANHDIAAGTILTADMLTVKRPGGGIPAKYLDKKYSAELLGKKARRDLLQNATLQWEDIMN